MQKIKKYTIVILGLLLIAISYNLFFVSYELDTGGISGLAIVIKKLFQINESLFIMICNIFLIILSYIFLGKDLTKNTLLGSLLLPLMIRVTENTNKWIIIKDLDPILIAIIGGTLSGIGYGLIFKNNFTSGGTDILNQIAEKNLKIPISKSMIYIDGAIVLFGGIVLGIEKMIYSIIALLLISNLSNKTMLNINKNKVFYIQTTKYKSVTSYLTEDLKYDITIFDTLGGFTLKSQKLILCSIKSSDYYKVKTGLELIDPKIFITITENYELLNENQMVPTYKL